MADASSAFFKFVVDAFDLINLDVEAVLDMAAALAAATLSAAADGLTAVVEFAALVVVVADLVLLIAVVFVAGVVVVVVVVLLVVVCLNDVDDVLLLVNLGAETCFLKLFSSVAVLAAAAEVGLDSVDEELPALGLVLEAAELALDA